MNRKTVNKNTLGGKEYTFDSETSFQTIEELEQAEYQIAESTRRRVDKLMRNREADSTDRLSDTVYSKREETIVRKNKYGWLPFPPFRQRGEALTTRPINILSESELEKHGHPKLPFRASDSKRKGYVLRERIHGETERDRFFVESTDASGIVTAKQIAMLEDGKLMGEEAPQNNLLSVERSIGNKDDYRLVAVNLMLRQYEYVASGEITAQEAYA